MPSQEKTGRTSSSDRRPVCSALATQHVIMYLPGRKPRENLAVSASFGPEKLGSLHDRRMQRSPEHMGDGSCDPRSFVPRGLGGSQLARALRRFFSTGWEAADAGELNG